MRKTYPEVSILIVSYNTREMTLECLRAIQRETTKYAYEVIVVDNRSTDGSAGEIASEFPEMTLLRSHENLGFARANNLAAERAQGKYLLLLNPDTVVLDHAIDKLIDFAESTPTAKIWGGRTVYADGTLNPGSCLGDITIRSLFFQAVGLRRLLSFSEIFNSESYGDWQRDTVREVDIVTGCFFMMPRDYWNRLGGFSPIFYMYGEEVDLCIRARADGARPLLYPEATIVHFGGASDPIRIEQRIAVLRARVTLIHRHWSPLRRRVGKSLMVAMAFAHSQVCALAARLLPREALKESAQYYAQVWRRREEWLPGYTFEH